MILAEIVANDQAAHLGRRLDGGTATIIDAAGVALAVCRFSSPAFADPAQGKALARPIVPGIGLADGAPVRFEAFDAAGAFVLSGTAGHKDAAPAPEMKFKVRTIVRDADVPIESFELSVFGAPEDIPPLEADQ